MLVFPKYYCNEYKSYRSYCAKMIFFLLTAFWVIDGSSAQTSEERCDPHELTLCANATPRTQVGLPRTTEELDKHCQAYHMGMSCMDTWIKRCLATDKQKLVQQQIGGARALMRYLCSNDTALRRDFLKEVSCWSLVSPDWSRCVDELQLASRDISERSHHITYFNKNTEICCAREAFVSCVGHAGRACSSAAGALLQRMAWVLAQDVAACSPAGEQPRAPCAAPQPPHGSSAQTSEERCDPHELTLCANATPRTQVGLPRTTEELDKHCQAYHMGMSCMDTWIKRCLATDKQKLVQQQIGGARALMRYLCSNDTSLRRDFLKEVSCWSLVSPDWSRCVDELQLASRDISEHSHHINYFNKNTEMCCAREAFVSCVGHAGRACSSAAGALLQRMAWVLAQDVAACSPAGEQPRAPCAAPQPPRLSALLSLLYYVYYT